jgi:hypothetical protein
LYNYFEIASFKNVSVTRTDLIMNKYITVISIAYWTKTKNN